MLIFTDASLKQIVDEFKVNVYNNSLKVTEGKCQQRVSDEWETSLRKMLFDALPDDLKKHLITPNAAGSQHLCRTVHASFFAMAGKHSSVTRQELNEIG